MNRTINIMSGERRITGTYTVSSGIITVRCDGLSKTTQVGTLQPDILAGLLLRELARELGYEKTNR